MPEEPLIIRAGRAVDPRPIEAVLLTHPAVAEAAVLGIPDPYWGEAVGAAIRLAGRLPDAAATLAEYCATRLATAEIPERWLFANRLPRCPDGSIRSAPLTAVLAIDLRLPRRMMRRPRKGLWVPRQSRRPRAAGDWRDYS